MCVAALAIGQSTDWPLAIISNRDEFFDRPTAPLQRWQTAAGLELVSGRDLRDGGTWLGISSQRVALLTNVREVGHAPGQRSRGELALRWLSGASSGLGGVQDFLSGLSLQDYAGFNLLLGEPARGLWHFVSNRPAALPALPRRPAAPPTGPSPQPLQPGLYGLSNASLDTPWPKTVYVKNLLASALATAHSEDGLTEHLLTGLAQQQSVPDAQLPATGVPIAHERELASVFVRMPDACYGTRCSTVALLGADGRWRITEHSHPRPLAAASATVAPTSWPGRARESVLLAPPGRPR